MDDIDMKIIKLLEENGRLTHEEISKQLHISRSSVHQRVARLEKTNIIKGYCSIIDWSKLDEKIKALIHIKIKCIDYNEFAVRIISLNVPGVTILECQRLAGEWCMMLKVRVTAPQDITNLIDEMARIPEIRETSTTFILSTILENGISEKNYTTTKGTDKI